MFIFRKYIATQKVVWFKSWINIWSFKIEKNKIKKAIDNIVLIMKGHLASFIYLFFYPMLKIIFSSIFVINVCIFIIIFFHFVISM